MYTAKHHQIDYEGILQFEEVQKSTYTFEELRNMAKELNFNEEDIVMMETYFIILRSPFEDGFGSQENKTEAKAWLLINIVNEYERLNK